MFVFCDIYLKSGQIMTDVEIVGSAYAASTLIKDKRTQFANTAAQGPYYTFGNMVVHRQECAGVRFRIGENQNLIRNAGGYTS